MELKLISTALRNGCKLHAFRSGGGLRVVSLKKGDALKGYGEHPNVNDALVHAEEDFAAGGRPYGEVYGKKKPHYLTGSSEASGQLDAWLLDGSTFDAWCAKGAFVFELQGYKQLQVPEELCKKVEQHGGVEYWEERNFLYEITQSGHGSRGVSIQCTNPSPSASSMMWRIKKTGRGATLQEAITEAFKAEEVEITQV